MIKMMDLIYETIRNIRATTQERTQLRDRQRRTEKMGGAEQSTEF